MKRSTGIDLSNGERPSGLAKHGSKGPLEKSVTIVDDVLSPTLSSVKIGSVGDMGRESEPNEVEMNEGRQIISEGDWVWHEMNGGGSCL